MFSQLPAWMIFLLGVVWVIAKSVVTITDRRRERKRERIKREFESKSMPPPPLDAPKWADDTGRHIIMELEAERSDREKLQEIHKSVMAAEEWRGELLAIEAKQNDIIASTRRIVVDLREDSKRDATFHAAMLDAQAETNELLRELLLAVSGGPNGPSVRSTLGNLKSVKRGDSDY